MKIPLTHGQSRQLLPYFDRMRATAALGRPGMLLAQLYFNPHTSGYYMVPAFLPHEHAKVITECAQEVIPGNTRQEGGR